MAEKSSGIESIDPNAPYTLLQMARLLNVTPRWLKENLILTGELPIAARGQLVMMMGFAISAWVQREMKCYGENDPVKQD